MKLSNQNGADLFQVKKDDCNIIVKQLLGQIIRDLIIIRRIKREIFYVKYKNEEYEESSNFLKLCKLREEKFQGTLWEYENPKVNVTQRSPWNSIYVTFSFERRAETSLLILSVDRLMKVDYSPHSLQSIEL